MAAWHAAHAWLLANPAPAALTAIANNNTNGKINGLSISPHVHGKTINYEATSMIFSRRTVGMVAAAVILSGAVVARVYRRMRPPQPSLNQQSGYVNSAVCTGCHADLAAGFHKTGMGRSFARVRPEHVPEFGKPFHHKASDSYLAMLARDGRYYQRRWQIGFDGKDTNVEEKQIDF